MGIVDILVRFTIDEEKTKAAGMRALKAEAMILKGRSQEMCPVDTGTLRSSCVIEQSDNNIIVGYGGAASAYAAVQHENLQFHHTVGQAKFLEKAFDDMENEIKEAVAKAVAEAFG